MKLTIGQVYEITPLISISWNGFIPPESYYAKCIGFNSKDQPVFERDGGYFASTCEYETIKELKQ